MDFLDFSANKGFRLLSMYERLNKGEELNKQILADEFGVSLKTIQRNIDDLRHSFAPLSLEQGMNIKKASHTLDTYADVFNYMHSGAISKLDNYLNSFV